MKDIKNVILSLCFFIVGCGPGFYPAPYIDPEFIPYVEEYKQDKSRYLSTQMKSVSIQFGLSDDSLDGQCEISAIRNRITDKTIFRIRIIRINKEHWQYFNPITRKILIYHELGHCDLNLDHSDTTSIMNPYALSDYLFNLDQEYYLDLLFNKGI